MSRVNRTIALDFGSTILKGVAFAADGRIVATAHESIGGKLHEAVISLLEAFQDGDDPAHSSITAITGASAPRYADLFGLTPVNEMISCYHGAVTLLPCAGAILEIGGERARFLRLRPAVQGGARALLDSIQNSVCSAGTGSFLAQEAHRFGFSIEEFGRLAAGSTGKLRIAGRCAVFAKTDIVHQQQNGASVADIAAALCRAVAQAVRAELIGHKAFDLPLAFVGGVAANPGIHKALADELDMDPSSLVVTDHHLFSGAIGALESARQAGNSGGCHLAEALSRGRGAPETNRPTTVFVPPLMLRRVRESKPDKSKANHPAGSWLDQVLLGIDVGSTSTNAVCLSSSLEVVAVNSVATQGQPLTAVRRALEMLRSQFGPFSPRTVGVTGSGREFIAGIFGADLAINEITAHAAGAAHFYPDVDTVFDIGGQDAKFISIQDGVVLDFAMNKVCSAGTGSFLEEMSTQLDLDIRDEFSTEAMRSKSPLELGERCTVFMSSELRRRQQQGIPRSDLAAGLCYAVVRNYLSRVVGRRTMGCSISFQGGVASNPAIVAALESVLEGNVRVHGHHEIAGAVGAAILAGKRCEGPTRFRGFEILDSPPAETRSFQCEHCENNCVVHHSRDPDNHRLFAGGLCDRYESRSENSAQPEPSLEVDLFAKRREALERHLVQHPAANHPDVLGIPRALIFHDLIPFWTEFLNCLGVRYRFSGQTTRRTVRTGVSRCPVNTCLPLITAYGHCAELIQEGAGRLLVPSIANLAFCTKPERLSHLCPAVQAWPFTARALFREDVSWLAPTVRFSIPPLLRSDMLGFGSQLGFNSGRSRQALKYGLQAQKSFYEQMDDLGQTISDDFDGDTVYAVILTRPYTYCDPQINLPIQRMLRDLGVVAVPMDLFQGRPSSSGELEGMYWYYGKRLLQTVMALKDMKRLAFIFLSTFGCGPDSFQVHFLRELLPQSRLLELELDQHFEFTGIRTRLEAFFDSLRNGPIRGSRQLREQRQTPASELKDRELLVPQMSDHAFAFAGALRSCEVSARVLPLPDKESIHLGKQAVTGHECLPCSFLMGDMLKALANHDENRPQPAFYMVSGDGPCRLGQYPYLQRKILDARGYEEALILDTSQDETFYDKLGAISSAFKRLAWQGIVATDLLHARWRHLRTYVEDSAGFDSAYREELAAISRTIETRESLAADLRRALHRLSHFPRTTISRRPVVAILGENYVRCNSAANRRTADLVEEFGAEAWFPALFEWITYTNWTACRHCLYDRKIGGYLKLRLIDAMQSLYVRRLMGAVGTTADEIGHCSLSRIFRLTSSYVPKMFEGETIVTAGKTVDCHDRGMSGVINVVPFGCIVGTIYETLSSRISEDLDGFPIMTIPFDGQQTDGLRSQIEGFMLQVRAWREQKQTVN